MLRDNYTLLEDTEFSSTTNKKIVKDTKHMVETVSFYVLENYNLLQNLVNLLKDLGDLQKRIVRLKNLLPENIIDFLFDNSETDSQYKEQFL